jgi:hypothetical protein
VKQLVAIGIALVASRNVAADPPLPRVLTAPTAWLPPDGGAIGTAGIDHRGDGSIDLGFGLGGLAGIELGADTDVRECDAPPCATNNGTGNLAQTRWQARAAFRLGARQDALFKGQPALVFGVRTAITNVRRIGEAYVVASRVISLVRLHAGVAAMDAKHGTDGRMGTTIRPLGGLELTPPQYPKTTLLGDIAWLPRLEPDDSMTMRVRDTPEWVIGWGVRYQALSWGSIELDVRHRENEGLGASTVMVRVNGVLETK